MDRLTLIAFAMALSSTAGFAGLVTNSSFEGGAVGVGAIPSWTIGGSSDTGGLCGLAPAFPAHTGTCAAGFFSAAGFGTVSQTIATSPGAQYTLSFWLWSNSEGPNELRVLFGSLASFDFVNISAQDYTFESTTVTATGSSTLVEIDGLNVPGTLAVDDFDVVALGSASPEPSSLALALAGLAALTVWRTRASGR